MGDARLMFQAAHFPGEVSLANEANLELVAALGDEFVRRRDAGEHPTIEEYAGKYPEFATEIRDFFAALLMVNSLNSDVGERCNVYNVDKIGNNSNFPVIDDYRIHREIARGGMGVVYEARQLSLERLVAIKVLAESLSQNSIAVERFNREARSAASLHHTNIVPVHDVGSQSKVHYYSMQLIHGRPLDKVILELDNATTKEPGKDEMARTLARSISVGCADVRQEKFANKHHQTLDVSNAEDDETVTNSIGTTDKIMSGDPSTDPGGLSSSSSRRVFFQNVADVGSQIADGLGYAHSQGILHRDIKPSNVLLDLAGKAWITDFGLAKTEEDGLTKTGDVVGTLRYMAPERFEGICDERSDVYSLGMTLYELLVLKPAFDSSDQLSLLNKIRNIEPPKLRSLVPTVPRDLQTIVAKAIAKEPDRRYQSAAALASDLNRFVEGHPIKARKTSLLEKTLIWSRRNPALATLSLVTSLIVMLTVAGSIYAAWKFRDMAIIQRDLAFDARESEQAALRSADDLNHSLYLADMRLAQEALARPTGIQGVKAAIEKWLPEKNRNQDYRGWEWYWLNSVAYREHSVTKGSWVNTIEFHPNGKSYAYTDSEYVFVRDIETNSLIRKFGKLGNPLWSVKFSPDGKRMAVSTRLDRKMAILSYPSGDIIKRYKVDGEMGAVAWSPTGKQLVFAAATKAGRHAKFTLHLWDESTNRVKNLQKIECYDLQLAFDCTGQYLAIGQPKQRVAIISTKNWQLVKSRRLEFSVPTEVQWDPAGKLLAVSAKDKFGAYIWNVEKDVVTTLKTPTAQRVETVSWHPTGKILVGGSQQSGITIWDTATKKVVEQIYGNRNTVKMVKWSLDGKYLFSTEHGNVRSWDMDAYSPITRIKTNVSQRRAKLFWRTDGTITISGDRKSEVVEPDACSFLNRESPPKKQSFSIRHVSYNKAGNRMVGVQNKTIKVWKAHATNQQELIRELHFSKITTRENISDFADLGWNPAMDKLLFRIELRRDGRVWVWDPEQDSFLTPGKTGQDGEGTRNTAWSNNGQFVALMNAFDLTVVDTFENRIRVNRKTTDVWSTAIAWSPDDRLIAIGGTKGKIAIHDSQSGDRIQQLFGHSGEVKSLAWSTDGRRLASSSQDGTVRVWNVETAQCTLLFEQNNSVLAVTWDPLSRQLASLDVAGVVTIYDARRGYELNNNETVAAKNNPS